MLIKLSPLFVALCGILRSTDLFFRTPVVAALPVLTIITWEHLINLVVVLPIIIKNFKQYAHFNRRDFLLFLLVGCGASAMGVLCFTRAFIYINPALAVLLQKLQPVITLSLGVFVLKEKIGKNFFVWAIIAIISSYFVSFGLTNPLSGEGKKIATGALFAVLASFFWGSGTIWGKLLLEKFSQTFVMSNRFLFGAIFTLAATFLFGEGLQSNIVFNNENSLIGSLLYMAIVSGFIATSFFYAGLKWVPASMASILELFFPVSSVIIMWLGFKRPITLIQIIAGIIMFIAVYKINKFNPIEKEEVKAAAP
jgi:drug/metabolite transporter (DMT)-like permease